jgi:peptidyl-prolyl cis-trans isomerase D
VETQFGYHYIMRDDPAKAADIEAKVKRSVGRSMYAKAAAVDAAKKVAEQIRAAIGGGMTADDAIRDAVASVVHAGGKVDRLRVLVPPAAATDAGTTRAVMGTVDAGASATPTPLPEKVFDASTDADRPQVQTSSAFNRGGDPFPGLSPDGTTSIVDFAFSSQDGNVIKDPIRMPDGFVVVQLKQHKTATRDEFAKDRETFVQELVRAKRDEALSLYVRRLRDQAKDDIKVDPSFIQETKVDGGGGGGGGGEDEDEY